MTALHKAVESVNLGVGLPNLIPHKAMKPTRFLTSRIPVAEPLWDVHLGLFPFLLLSWICLMTISRQRAVGISFWLHSLCVLFQLPDLGC